MDDAGVAQGDRGHVSANRAAASPRLDGGEPTTTSWSPPSARGDDRAFEALYQRYHRRIAAYIYGMVHDHAPRRGHHAGRLHRPRCAACARPTGRSRSSRGSTRSPRTRASTSSAARARAEEVSYDADDGLGRRRLRPPRQHRRRRPTPPSSPSSALDHLRGAFGGLSETHHEILVMRELEGLSYREIGERLGMSRPSVESTLFRARRRLTEEYEELVSGERCQRIQAIIAAAAAAALGARDQRRLARHVSYCQPCRRQARLSGSTSPSWRAAGARADRRVPAAPAFLRGRWLPGTRRRRGHRGGVAAAGGHARAVVRRAVPSGPGWLAGPRRAAAATLAVAGAGAGAASQQGSPGAERALPGLGRGQGGLLGRSCPHPTARHFRH